MVRRGPNPFFPSSFSSSRQHGRSGGLCFSLSAGEMGIQIGAEPTSLFLLGEKIEAREESLWAFIAAENV